MIPKIIHYCWFGGKQKPEEVRVMIESWKKHCPGYTIKEWNEDNFDIRICRYSEEAYQQRKWAFVSDVARLYALHQEGGIYLDTDVEMVRPLDPLLHQSAFLGFEGTQWIATSIIATEPGNPMIKSFLDSYHDRTFLNGQGQLDQTTNVEEWTKRLLQAGLTLDGKEQQVGSFRIYPTDYFTPYDYINGKLTKTENTYAIHWFNQSWIGNREWKTRIAQLYHRIVGIKMK